MRKVWTNYLLKRVLSIKSLGGASSPHHSRSFSPPTTLHIPSRVHNFPWLQMTKLCIAIEPLMKSTADLSWTNYILTVKETCSQEVLVSGWWAPLITTVDQRYFWGRFCHRWDLYPLTDGRSISTQFMICKLNFSDRVLFYTPGDYVISAVTN